MSQLSFTQYRRYFVVGSGIGLMAIALRELIAWMLAEDSALHYSASIIIVYAIAIAVSYAAQRTLTFAQRGRGSMAQVGAFSATALLGGLVTWLVALAVRYGLQLDRHLGALGPGSAFAIGAVSASILTYYLHARFIFAERAERSTNNG